MRIFTKTKYRYFYEKNENERDNCKQLIFRVRNDGRAWYLTNTNTWSYYTRIFNFKTWCLDYKEIPKKELFLILL